MATATHNLISASRSVRAGMREVCGLVHQGYHQPMAYTPRTSWQGLDAENCSLKRLAGSFLQGFSDHYCLNRIHDSRSIKHLKACPVKVRGLANDGMVVIENAA